MSIINNKVITASWNEYHDFHNFCYVSRISVYLGISVQGSLYNLTLSGQLMYVRLQRLLDYRVTLDIL